MPLMAEDPNAQEQVLELGTPTLSYVRMWQSYNNNMQSRELYVPSMVFPVINEPEEGGFYQRSITIPIVKELLDSRPNTPPSEPSPEPTPVDPVPPVEPSPEPEPTPEPVEPSPLPEPQPAPLPEPVPVPEPDDTPTE